MVELSRTFSFNEQILTEIIKHRHKYSEGEAEINPDLESVKRQLNAHIVGQERDSTILVAWNDRSPRGTGGHKVSYIAAYEPSHHQLKILFVHDKKVEITGASVNQEGTLLGFTTTEPYYGTFEDPNETDYPGIYKSFLAEIRPQNRIFSLYIERHTYQRVQFLYGDYQGYGRSSEKESHMLFFHHKEAVGLYHIPMARIGDKGMIMSNQPRTERVCDAFLWAQWDTLNQRLYYLYNKKTMDVEQSVEQSEAEPELMFAAFQFAEKASHIKVLNMTLPFTITPDDIASSTPKYRNLSMTQIVSERHFNMQVVSTHGGSLYICLQHPYKKKEQDLLNVVNRDSPSNALDMGTLEYSVYLLHHDCILHCVLRSVVPIELVQDATLFFSSFNDLLMVLLPGYALHLLNGSAEHEPCHHVILQDDVIPRFSVQQSRDPPPVLLYLYKKQTTSIHTDPYLLDSTTGDAYQCSFNKKALIDIFSKTHLATTRLTLLHLAMVHLRDSYVVRKMVGHLCYDPASPECSDLLKEYLVGSTYGLFKRELDRDVLKLLPFTCVDTFRGHLEESLDKRRIANITCTLCRDTPSDFKISKNDKKKENYFWSAVKTSKENARKTSCRFSFKALPMLFDEESDEELEVVAQQQMGAVKTLWRKLSIRSYPSNESINSIGSTRSAEFLESNEGEGTKLEDRKKKMVIDKLALHLQTHLPRESKSKTENVAAEYVKYQSRQSEALLRLFWAGLGFTSETNPATTSLSVRGAVSEVAFFQMVERYYTSVTDLNFPFPSGFQTFFTTLAFRSLDPRMFLQYVNNEVLQLTDHFICRLIEDCGGKSGNSELVFQIISRLKHEKAKKAMLKWEHPLCSRYMSQHSVDDLLSQDFPGDRDPLDSLSVSPRDGASSPSGSAMENDTAEFPPLATLMSALRARAAQLTLIEGRRVTTTLNDLKNIEDLALVETSREIDGDLGSVSF